MQVRVHGEQKKEMWLGGQLTGLHNHKGVARASLRDRQGRKGNKGGADISSEFEHCSMSLVPRDFFNDWP